MELLDNVTFPQSDENLQKVIYSGMKIIDFPMTPSFLTLVRFGTYALGLIGMGFVGPVDPRVIPFAQDVKKWLMQTLSKKKRMEFDVFVW